MEKPYKLNGKEVTYGSFEELQQVAISVRKLMFDYITGKIDEKRFFLVYCEFEGHLLEHGYTTEDFDYDLPDYESFIKSAEKK